MKEKFVQLGDVSEVSLRACFVEDKIVASPGHFSDFWARDTFFALPGMLVIGEHARARECIAYFLSLQREDGKIPRKVSRDINVIKYLTGRSIKRKNPRPTYHGLIPPFLVMDSEFLLIIAMSEYLEATRDYDFAEQEYMRVRRAIMWHIDHASARGGLVHEHFLGNWMDTVFKFGAVLYTNVLYARALEAMVLIAQVAGRDDDAEHFVQRAMSARKRIRREFWNGEYFADETRLIERKTFDLSGNVLAVVYGIADEAQKKSVVSHVLAQRESHGDWLPSVPTGHRWYKVNGVVRIMGIADYHTQTSWLWINALTAQMLWREEREDLAQEMFHAIENVARRDGEIGETYFQNGKPYKKRLWKSASPFAWSSGIILNALVVCGYKKKKEITKEDLRVC